MRRPKLSLRSTCAVWIVLLLSPAPPPTEARPLADAPPIETPPKSASLQTEFEPATRRGAFLARVGDGTALVTGSDATLAERGAWMRMRFAGADSHATVEPRERLEGVSHYFAGSDRSRWRTNVPHYRSIRARAVYPGIDIVYHGIGSRLEYDVVVSAGADPAAVAIEIEGADSLAVDAAGALVAGSGSGAVRHERPRVYQEIEGARVTVAARFVLRDTRTVTFDLGAYDTSRPLVIDPEIVYSFSLDGGGNERALGVAVDGSGNAVFTGTTTSADLPTAGAIDATLGGTQDVFVAKLNAAGTAVAWATYLGGGAAEFSGGVGVDGSGNVVVSGSTGSSDFPTTAGAFQTELAGGRDTFVARLAPDGSALVSSTLLGGAGDEGAGRLAVDASGGIHITGQTASPDFPTTPNAFKTALGGGSDAFVATLDPSGGTLEFSSYLGATGSSTGEVGYAISCDVWGDLYVVGLTTALNFPVVAPVQAEYGGGFFDAFVAKVTATGELVFSSYLGGAGLDFALGVAATPGGQVYVAGHTESADFPTAAPLQASLRGPADAFVTRIDTNSGAPSIAASTYLGGSGFDEAQAVTIAPGGGSVTIAGTTTSTDYPVEDPVQATYGGGQADAVVTRLGPRLGEIEFSSYLGGAGPDFASAVADDGDNALYLAVTANPDLARAATPREQDLGRLVKLNLGPPPAKANLVTKISRHISESEERPGEICVTIGVTVSNESDISAFDVEILIFISRCISFAEVIAAPGPDGVLVSTPPPGTRGSVVFRINDPMRARTSTTAIILTKFLTSDQVCFRELKINAAALATTSTAETDKRDNVAFLEERLGERLPTRSVTFVEPPSFGTPPARAELTEIDGAVMRAPSLDAPLFVRRREARGGDVLGYRVYSSTQPNVQPVEANLFAELPPDVTYADVDAAPDGAYFVVTALYGSGESPKSNEVGGALPTITKLNVSASKITAEGTGFAPGLTVSFGGLEFESPAKLKRNNTKVVQKARTAGGLTLARILDQLLEPGSTVLVTFRNPNGNGVAVVYRKN